MDKNQSPLLAVDLGGTKCSAALISPTPQILHRKQEATCQAGAQAGIEQIVRLCKEILVERERSLAQVGALGVSIAALLETSSDRVIWAPHLEGWADVPLRTLLEEQLKIPVAVEFDGHAAVLGEWWAGSGKGYHSLVNVIVGTGIGGGMILDGKLYRGANRLAGAAGWFTFFNTPEHSRERASRFGGWEAMAAGPGLVEHTIKLAKQLSGSRLYEIAQPDSLTPADIFACA